MFQTTNQFANFQFHWRSQELLCGDKPSGLRPHLSSLNPYCLFILGKVNHRLGYIVQPSVLYQDTHPNMESYGSSGTNESFTFFHPISLAWFEHTSITRNAKSLQHLERNPFIGPPKNQGICSRVLLATPVDAQEKKPIERCVCLRVKLGHP